MTNLQCFCICMSILVGALIVKIGAESLGDRVAYAGKAIMDALNNLREAYVGSRLGQGKLMLMEQVKTAKEEKPTSENFEKRLLEVLRSED